MTTTIGNFEVETLEGRKKPLYSSIYRTLESTTAGTVVTVGRSSEYQSVSMTPLKNGEPRHPIIVFYYLGINEEKLASTPEVQTRLSLPELWPHPEPDPRVWRGVFSPSYHPTVLFSQELTVRTADLPRRRPHVVIDRRTLARDEDE
jgi:hypothetical protein